MDVYKEIPALFILKDGFFVVPSSRDVIEGTIIFNSQGPGLGA